MEEKNKISKYIQKSSNLQQKFWIKLRQNSESLLFNIQSDYAQNKPLVDKALESQYIGLLRQTLADHDCPREQYLRLGI